MLARTLPIALSLLCAAACGGEDHGGTETVINTGDVAGSDLFTVAFTAPAANAVVAGQAQIDLAIAVTPPEAGLSADFSVDGQALQLETDKALDSSGTLTIHIAMTAGSHRVHVHVDDGGSRSAEAEVVFMVNVPPPAPTVTCGPTAPGDQDVSAHVDVEDTSTLGGLPLKKTYQWRKLPSSDIVASSETLPAALTARDDTFELTVVANDGWVDGPPGTCQVTIADSAPSCTGLLLRPAAGDTTQDVTCACAGWSDADGDADHSTCQFIDVRDGSPIDTGGSCTLPASMTDKGMTIACTLTPNDGTAAGGPLSSSSGQAVTILNSAPSAPAASLTPPSGDAATSFTCTLATPSTDADHDSLSYVVAWTVAGSAASTTAAAVVPSSIGAKKGQALCCTLSASDGSATSPASAPACTTLDDAAPTLGTVLLTTDDGALPATRRSTLSCQVHDAADADGDALTLTYAWYADGVLVAGASGATLDAQGLPLGARVSCTVTACDPEDACAEATDSKNSLVLVNALPEIDSVSVVDADGHAQEDDALICTWDGWDDPDGDPAAVVYAWVVTDPAGHETVLPGETDPTLIVQGLTPGDTVSCRVTPVNGADLGPAKDSDNSILVVVPTPVPPSVTVLAPSGADGDVTCQVTNPGKYIPAGATTTFYWSIDGGPEAPGGMVRLAADVSHCDLVKCRARITGAGGLDLSSNTASLQMPLGSDCDDHNPCTAAVCLQAGGCNAVPEDGVACDDGDPCSDLELCDAGKCVGSVDICSEDRLSVGATSYGRPYVGAGPSAGYATTWFGNGDYQSFVRSTDADESRVGEEQGLQPAGAAGTIASGPTVLPDGTVLTFRNSTPPYNPYNNLNQFPLTMYLQRWSPEMKLLDETAVANWLVASALFGPPWYAFGGYRIQALGFADNGMGVIHATRNALTWEGIKYRTVATNLALGAEVVLVPPASVYTPSTWSAAPVPDGTDDFLLVWADAANTNVLAQRFTRAGVPLWAAPLQVATVGVAVAEMRVAAFPNGRFVVAWEAAGIDGAGQGIRAQRFDDQGSFIGQPFTLSAATSGDQRLGDLGAFSDYHFVVAYRDASTPTPTYLARTFSSAAVGDAPIIVNETSAVSASPPALSVLSNGDYVVAWRDSANVLWTRRYKASGAAAPASAELRANDEVSHSQETPSAAGTATGSLMVAYASPVYPGGDMGHEIVARVFDPDGLEVSPEQIVNTTLESGQTTPAVAGSADGFVVAWNSDGQDGEVDGIFARRFDDLGEPQGDEFGVNLTTQGYQRQPAVAMAADGTAVFAWNAQGTPSQVALRVFAPNGVATGELTVNKASPPGPQDHPAVAVVPFATQAVVVWQSQGEDEGGYGIVAQKVGFDGTKVGPQVRINATGASDQRNPTVAVSQSGYFVACWESVGQGPGGALAVVCQRMKTSTMTPQGGEYLPFAFAADQSTPVARYLSSGRLAVAWAGLGLDQQGQAVQLARVNDVGSEVAPRIVANRFGANDQYRPFLVASDDRLFVGWQSNGQAGPVGEGDIYFRIIPIAP